MGKEKRRCLRLEAQLRLVEIVEPDVSQKYWRKIPWGEPKTSPPPVAIFPSVQSLYLRARAPEHYYMQFTSERVH